MQLPIFIKDHHKKILLLLGSILLLFLLYTFIPWLTVAPLKDSTRIYDASGTLLFEVHSPRSSSRKEITYEELPEHLVQALTSAEDQRFWSHHGIDTMGVGRAFWGNVTGGTRSGASTLTQQYMKLRFYPTSARTLIEKIREVTAASVYELTHSKKEIMISYLNTAYFGQKSYGIYAASETYFHKVPKELSLGESAFLVGLLPSPESANPYKYPLEAEKRITHVLSRMVDEHFITIKEKEETPTSLFYATEEPRPAAHFVDYVLSELEKTYPDLEEGGYEITTTLQLSWQKDGEAIIKKQVENLKDRHITNAGMIVMEPNTGKIRVMVGSKDYFTGESGKFNVTTAKRQPGSSLKPFTYLTSFMQGKNPTDIIRDTEASFTTASGSIFTPKNYDLKYHGPVSMATALGSSLNIPAVKTLDSIGLPAFFETMRHFGISFEKDPEYYGLGITLGGGEVRLLDLTHAYSMLANGGEVTPTVYLERIRKDGKELPLEKKKSEPLFPGQELLAKQGIYLVNHVLRDNNNRTLSFGEANRLDLGEHVAVKTGTTKDYHDNWALGYTPRIAVGVWVGNNDNSPMEGVSGITGAIPIWSDFMRLRKNMTQTIQESEWKKPEGMITLPICSLSGMKATELCPSQTMGLFMEKNAPEAYDTWYKKITIDAPTGLLYKETCGKEKVEKIMLDLPVELLSWAESVHMNLIPQEYCDHTFIENSDPFLIVQPKDGEIFYIDSKKPLEAQQIPLTISGKGLLSSTLYYDQTVIASEKSTQRTFFLKPFLGKHVITLGKETRSFEIKALP